MIPFVFTPEELVVIRDNCTNHLDWTKPDLAPIKTRLKAYLRIQQNNKCCYCMRELSWEPMGIDIEHILPKSKYFDYMFEPRNLALSCKHCNTNKGSQHVLHNTTISRYPRTNQNIKIVHAYYDLWTDHIDLVGYCVYYPKTKRGSVTSTMCGLYELRVALQNARDYLAVTQSEEAELVERIRNASKESAAVLIMAVAQLANK
jgi:uncharacterized protein (TIGR02646 family)